jgi:O-methyltransferase
MAGVATDDRGVRLYLDLLKRVLTRHVTGDAGFAWPVARGSRAEQLIEELRRELGHEELQLWLPMEFDPAVREQGKDLPTQAETLIGLRRLESLDHCIRTVLEDQVPGDLMECGVWRGGATIFMRAALDAYRDESRQVWVADSFAGLPPADPETFPDDAEMAGLGGGFAVSREEVEANFRRYGVHDERVRFLEGHFRDTLPAAPVEGLAVLRLDGDYYESTFVALEALYDRVAPGGFVIVDDYSLRPTRTAVEEFRLDHGIDEPLEQVDWTEVRWRKSVR